MSRLQAKQTSVRRRSSSDTSHSGKIDKRKPTPILGILGGGQLARMLTLKAHQLGIPVRILSEKPDDPAAQVTSQWVQGKLDDERVLREFLSSCTTVTFESEFLDAELLERLANESDVEIFPKPRHMALIQDRLTQKKLLLKHGLPTADFFAVSTAREAEKAFTAFSAGVVFKKRRFGYDGYGTFVVRDRAALEKFIPEIEKNPTGFIGEELIPFERELATMLVRGRRGQSFHLPFVETFQENSRCLWVKGPVRAGAPLGQLSDKLTAFMEAIGYVGVMGVELFAGGRKGLMINELAPRVHNSGHYSMDALSEDQFTLHVKAVMGEKVECPVGLSRAFAMMNLLGTHNEPPSWRLPSDVCFHWYGKSENRIGRKMGHINALAATPDTALSMVTQRRSDFKV